MNTLSESDLLTQIALRLGNIAFLYKSAKSDREPFAKPAGPRNFSFRFSAVVLGFELKAKS
jgi:hypothetical protein